MSPIPLGVMSTSNDTPSARWQKRLRDHGWRVLLDASALTGAVLGIITFYHQSCRPALDFTASPLEAAVIVDLPRRFALETRLALINNGQRDIVVTQLFAQVYRPDGSRIPPALLQATDSGQELALPITIEPGKTVVKEMIFSPHSLPNPSEVPAALKFELLAAILLPSGQEEHLTAAVIRREARHDGEWLEIQTFPFRN